MITIYFTDKALKFTTLDYTAAEGEVVVSQSDVTSANIDKFFETCNTIVVPTADCSAAFEQFSRAAHYIEAAGGIVRNAEGQVLMIRRFNRWDLPKGHIEQEEDSLTAAMREIEEETGVGGLIFDRQLCNTLHSYSVYGRWEIKRTYWFAFHCDKAATKPQTEEDITEVLWCDSSSVAVNLKDSYPTIREVFYEYEQYTKDSLG
jgi:8-oxo-dGTP pyrophosphatase MutT (NUDIX family)